MPILGANAIAQPLMMPAYPFWSLSIFALSARDAGRLDSHA